MITTNEEHKKAKLRKVIKLGVTSFIISIAGTVISVSVFIHSNYIKWHNVEIKADYGIEYDIDATTWEMITGYEDLRRDSLIDDYTEDIEKNTDGIIVVTDETENLDESNTILYDSNKTDEDTVELDKFLRNDILYNLKMHEERKNDEYQVKVSDLKKLNDIDIELSSDADISWLNYCDNLRSLTLYISSPEGLQCLSQIRKLENLHSLNIESGHFGYDGQAIIIDEKNFGFFKNLENLSFLGLDSEIFSINSQFLENLCNTRKMELKLYNIGAESQKIDVDILEKFSYVSFSFDYGNGLYDLPVVFTEEEFEKIMNGNFKFSFLEGKYSRVFEKSYDNREQKWEFDEYEENYIENLKNIYKQIDKIYSQLNIKDNIEDKEKLKIILEYVMKNLTYSETSKQLQQEYGYETNIVGEQNELLTDDLLENSYNNGMLYGALNENGRPVCGSYAALMQVLMEKAGFSAYLTSSRYHIYNLVNVDGEYYYVDATFLDEDVIDMDKLTENDMHLIPVGMPFKSYKTEIIPEGVELPEFDAEKRVDEIIYNAKREYLVKFNNQVIVVSASILMAVLINLGVAKKRRNLYFLESKEYMTKNEIQEEYEYYLKRYKEAKTEYEKLNILKKIYTYITDKNHMRYYKRNAKEYEEFSRK